MHIGYYCDGRIDCWDCIGLNSSETIRPRMHVAVSGVACLQSEFAEVESGRPADSPVVRVEASHANCGKTVYTRGLCHLVAACIVWCIAGEVSECRSSSDGPCRYVQWSLKVATDIARDSARALPDRPTVGIRMCREGRDRLRERTAERTSAEGSMRSDMKSIMRGLEGIRKRIGGRRFEFVPHGFERLEERDLNSAEEVEDLFHTSGLLIHLQHPVFIYIRDHTVGKYSDVSERNKLHFAVCSTLRMMKKKGRFHRYRRTIRVDDVYLIDVHARRREDREVELPLYPCKHCLMEVNYLCYKTALTRDDKQTIVEEFKAREALDVLRHQFNLFNSTTNNVQSDLFQVSTDS